MARRIAAWLAIAAAGLLGPARGAPAPEAGAHGRAERAEARGEGRHALTGRVVQAVPDRLVVEAGGVAVTVKLDRRTRFSGFPTEDARGVREGQLVAVTYDTDRDAGHVARTVSATTDATVGEPQGSGPTGSAGTAEPPGSTREVPVPRDGGFGSPPRDRGLPAPADPGTVPLPLVP